MNQFDYKEFYRRNLPHIQPPEATLFVTFRLDGSLPASVLEHWRVEKKQLEMTLLRWAATSPPGTVPDPEAIAEAKLRFQRRWFKKFEEALDGATTGPVWLKNEQVAAIVDEALRHRDGSIYRLDAFCIMPSHVHMVFAPLLTEALAREVADRSIQHRCAAVNQLFPVEVDDGICKLALASIMGALKGWTARRCNEALGRKGQFWQHESYDHVVRNAIEWKRIVNYVVENPVKAGLVGHWKDWPWNYKREVAEVAQSAEIAPPADVRK